MAKILKKLPKREHGKYINIGADSEDVLSNIQTINELMIKIQNDNDLTDDEKLLLKNYLQGLALISCVTVSYYNGNGLNTLQNAEKTGLTQDMSPEQIKILKSISRNTEMARILFATSKCQMYIMLVLSLGTLYIYGHNKFVYNLIQPEENYMFIGVAISALYSFLKYKSLSKKTTDKIQQLVNLNTL